MKKTFLLILASLAIPFLLYSADIFNEFVSALKNNAPKIFLEELQARYKDELIRGQAYIISVTRNIAGDTVVNLSTTKDPSLKESVNVVIFLRKYLAKRGLKRKPGQYVRFSGVFREIRLETIIVDKGIIK